VILPRASVNGVTESPGKFVADGRRFPGLFPMRARRLEQPEPVIPAEFEKYRNGTRPGPSCRWRLFLLLRSPHSIKVIVVFLKWELLTWRLVQ
jgi:hypothetical protein